MRLFVVQVMATVVLCGAAVASASESGKAGPAASISKRAALEVSVVVSPSCTVRTAARSAGTPPSFACSRGAMPAGLTPRTELISPGVRAAGAPGPSVTSAQSPILNIHF